MTLFKLMTGGIYLTLKTEHAMQLRRYMQFHLLRFELEIDKGSLLLVLVNSRSPKYAGGRQKTA